MDRCSVNRSVEDFVRRACPHMIFYPVYHIATLSNKSKTSAIDRVDLQNDIKNYGSLYLACNDRQFFFHFL